MSQYNIPSAFYKKNAGFWRGFIKDNEKTALRRVAEMLKKTQIVIFHNLIISICKQNGLTNIG